VSFSDAEKAVLDIIIDIVNNGLDGNELEKVKNKSITSNLFSKTSVLNKAMGLCYAHRLGNVELINTEVETMKAINETMIRSVCESYLLKGNQSVLNYKSK
jgi:hypothetical protein